MKNENENFVPEIDTAVQLPHVDEGNAHHAVASVDEAVAGMGLDEESTARIKAVLMPMEAVTIPQELLDMLGTALRHDEDVKNADAAGYVRGRNDNIDAGLHVPPAADDEIVEATFPRYVRRSVWD